MLTINDIEIKIKKFDREKQVVILNLVICEDLEIRGFRARYGTTKLSNGASVWIISPPAVRIGKNYFWICEIKNADLWRQIEEQIIHDVRAYTNY